MVLLSGRGLREASLQRLADERSTIALQVDQLRAEVARYQARLAELENDFLSLDVVANTEVRTC